METVLLETVLLEIVLLETVLMETVLFSLISPISLCFPPGSVQLPPVGSLSGPSPPARSHSAGSRHPRKTFLSSLISPTSL